MADPLASWMWMSLTAPPLPPPQSQDSHVLVDLDVLDRSFVPNVEKVQLQALSDQTVEVNTIVDANLVREEKAYRDGHFVSGVDKSNINVKERFRDLSKYLNNRYNRNEDRPWIWKVHQNMKEISNADYEPKIVPIGPFHHNNEKLKPMEDIKRKYLKRLLDRSPDNTLEKYLGIVQSLEDKARKQYSEKIDMTSEEFTEMLLVDGCFIIEYFLRNYLGKRQIPNDFLVGIGWDLHPIERDLLLLENQIPFFVLDKLFLASSVGHYDKAKVEPLTLRRIALKFLKLQRIPLEDLPGRKDVHHLLHLKYMCLIPTTAPGPSPDEQPASKLLNLLGKVSNMLPFVFYGLLYVVLIKCLGERDEYFAGNWKKEESSKTTSIPCATELRKFGIEFKRKQIVDEDSFLNITFSPDDGVLWIPRCVIGPMTISESRNFIAFERCQHIGNYFTEYVIFMDNIIDKVEDVAILRKYGIIETTGGSDKQVAQTFNKLSEGTHISHVTETFDPAPEDEPEDAPEDPKVPWQRNRIPRLFEYVNKYCDIPQNRWRASLRNGHLRSPWATISLFAAILAIATGIIQASFTISRPRG